MVLDWGGAGEGVLWGLVCLLGEKTSGLYGEGCEGMGFGEGGGLRVELELGVHFMRVSYCCLTRECKISLPWGSLSRIWDLRGCW